MRIPYGIENQADAHQAAREEPTHEELRDGFPGDHRIEDHGNARGDDHADRSGRSDERRGEIRVVFLLVHLRQQRCPHRGRRGRSRTGNRGDEHGRARSHNPQPSPDSSDGRLRDGQDPLRYAAPGQNVAGKDEKGNGNQGVRAASLEEGLGHHLQGNAGHHEDEERRETHGQSHGNTDEQQEEETPEEQPAHGSAFRECSTDSGQEMEDDRRAHSGKSDIDPGHGNLQARRKLLGLGLHEEGAVNHDDGEKKDPQKMHPDGQGLLRRPGKALRDEGDRDVGAPFEGHGGPDEGCIEQEETDDLFGP